MRSDYEQFESNQLVLAKLEGFPYWPAFINKKIKGSEYQVNYLDDFKISNLKTCNLKKFTYEEYQDGLRKKNNKLKNALNIAYKIYTGELDIDQYIEETNRRLSKKGEAIFVKEKIESLEGEEENIPNEEFEEFEDERINEDFKSPSNSFDNEGDQSLGNFYKRNFENKSFNYEMLKRKKNKYHSLRNKVYVKKDVYEVTNPSRSKINSVKNFENPQGTSSSHSFNKRKGNSEGSRISNRSNVNSKITEKSIFLTPSPIIKNLTNEKILSNNSRRRRESSDSDKYKDLNLYINEKQLRNNSNKTIITKN